MNKKSVSATATPRRGLSEESIFDSLSFVNRRCVPPLGDEKLRDIARSVATYSPKTSAMVDSASQNRPVRAISATAASSESGSFSGRRSHIGFAVFQINAAALSIFSSSISNLRRMVRAAGKSNRGGKR